MEKDRFKNKAATAQMIAKACAQAKPNRIGAKMIVSTLPETFVFTKTIQVPKNDKGNYNEVIAQEAAQYLPLPLNSLYLDYQPLIVHPNQSTIDLLVVATPKNLVDDYVEVARLAGLELLALETKPLAVGRALIPSNNTGGTMIVEIGTEVTRLSIWDGNKIRLSTTVGIGKNQLTKVGQKEVDTSMILPIVEEIIGTIKYHQNRELGAKTIEKILLCGSGATFSGIDKLLAEQTKLKTAIATPLLASKEQLGTEFVTAYGLALRQENE